MGKFVPYLLDETIERDAVALLAEYAQKLGVVIVPPIPIEHIIEKHLKLRIELDDTHRLFGVPRSGLSTEPDILGAMFFDEARIVIDESLDPEENPSKEGRYRFTLAHEGGGHWRLHRHQFSKDISQPALFDGPVPPSVICRSSQAKERVEWQADFYASCLLMPRMLVFDAWQREFGTMDPFVFKPEMHLASESDRFRNGTRSIGDIVRQLQKPAIERVFDEVSKRLSPRFGVSVQSMRIRLEKLGLLLREVPDQHTITGIG